MGNVISNQYCRRDSVAQGTKEFRTFSHGSNQQFIQRVSVTENDSFKRWNNYTPSSRTALCRHFFYFRSLLFNFLWNSSCFPHPTLNKKRYLQFKSAPPPNSDPGSAPDCLLQKRRVQLCLSTAKSKTDRIGIYAFEKLSSRFCYTRLQHKYGACNIPLHFTFQCLRAYVIQERGLMPPSHRFVAAYAEIAVTHSTNFIKVSTYLALQILMCAQNSLTKETSHQVKFTHKAIIPQILPGTHKPPRVLGRRRTHLSK